MQRYVSDELTHFVGRKINGDNKMDEQFSLLVEILQSGELGVKESYIGSIDRTKKLSSNKVYMPNVVCFCDIPVADYPIHMAKYSRFGLAFKKQLMLEKGAMPVFYIPINSCVNRVNLPKEAGQYFDREYERVYKFYEQWREETLCNSEQHSKMIFDLNHLKDFFAINVFPYFKFFEGGLSDDDESNYYMEREWRVYSKLKFEISDVERVIFPREYAERFRSDIPEYFGQTTFS